jgi:methionyl-tRNA formyltransferase
MNIVFMGSSHFGEPALRALIANGYKVSCVVTQTDKKKGRNMSLAKTPIKEAAQGLNLEIYQPVNINSPESIKKLKSLNLDLFVVLSYGQILSEEILNIPRIRAINVHASLLPAFRGAAPINWAIIKGEKITGNTLMKIVRTMDSGPIILQTKHEILDTDTAVSLEEKLKLDAADLLIEGIRLIETNDYNLLAQNQEKASFAPKLMKKDGLIDWKNSVIQIYNLIRGCLNWPVAFTYYKGKMLKILKAIPSQSESLKAGVVPGEVIKVGKEGISVAAADGMLTIQELQIEGKKSMPAQEFILGHKIINGEKFGNNSCKQLKL